MKSLNTAVLFALGLATTHTVAQEVSFTSNASTENSVSTSLSLSQPSASASANQNAQVNSEINSEDGQQDEAMSSEDTVADDTPRCRSACCCR